ncbi:hypothetical protein [Streptomyces sp. NPDC020983]|uniref:hypothetical protein n=1 Tax=Streptomyces sp. NPDC020983 TaxID=3365106 RepID=UPI0037BDCB9F
MSGRAGLSVLHGGRPLGGTVVVPGFKHSLVTALAMACMGTGEIRLENVPRIAESEVLARLIESAGRRVERTGDHLTVARGDFAAAGEFAPADVAAVHGSVYLAPAVLAHTGAVRMPPAGGCRIGGADGGSRPVRHYAEVLERFGAQAHVLPDGGLAASARRLRGCHIDLLDFTDDRARATGPRYSGASKFALLAAAAAEGTTVLRNLYPKPDVTDMIDVLAAMGATTDSPEPGTVVVSGGPDALTRDTRHRLLPDLIEVVTWISAAVVACPDGLRVVGAGMDRAVAALSPEFAVLDQMGLRAEVSADAVVVRPQGTLRPVTVVIGSHGAYSDSQPFLALLSCMADGVSRLEETVWPGRLGYADELRKVGADLRRDGRFLTARGPWRPTPTDDVLHAGDLRAAAVLVLAALAVPGRTVIGGLGHLARGYADFLGSLTGLGARIEPAASR